MGFLDDISYVGQSDEYSMRKRINRALVRKAQSDFFQKLFEEKNIPCTGPAFDAAVPVGGWYFKLASPTGNLGDYVLSQLGIGNSLKINLPEPYNDFTVFLGLLVGDFPGDPSQNIDFNRATEIEFYTCLSAFHARRGKEYSNPYLLVIDKDFIKKFLR